MRNRQHVLDVHDAKSLQFLLNNFDSLCRNALFHGHDFCWLNSVSVTIVVGVKKTLFTPSSRNQQELLVWTEKLPKETLSNYQKEAEFEGKASTRPFFFYTKKKSFSGNSIFRENWADIYDTQPTEKLQIIRICEFLQKYFEKKERF